MQIIDSEFHVVRMPDKNAEKSESARQAVILFDLRRYVNMYLEANCGIRLDLGSTRCFAFRVWATHLRNVLGSEKFALSLSTILIDKT